MENIVNAGCVVAKYDHRGCAPMWFDIPFRISFYASTSLSVQNQGDELFLISIKFDSFRDEDKNDPLRYEMVDERSKTHVKKYFADDIARLVYLIDTKTYWLEH